MKNKKFLIIMAFGIIAGSCNKSFLDVNSDPNRVTDENVTPELIFPAAATAVQGPGAIADVAFLDQWMGYFAPNGGFVPAQNLITYNIDFTFGDALFRRKYEVLYDLHQVKVKAQANGDIPLAGASMVLSAKLFQELVDLYGDIPFSQAFDIDKYPTPAYDKAQDIYNGLQVILDSAKSYLSAPPSNAFTSADIINHGDEGAWIKFANTLKLRLLIRQSEVSGFDPSSEIQKIASTNGSVATSIIGAGESVSVNPGYSNDVNKQNPYYADNGWSPTGAIANNSTNANAYILNILSDDPREERFFYPVGFAAGGNFVGNVFGDPVGTLASSANSSYFGPALVGDLLPSTSIGDGYSDDQFIYPSFESLFLYAEAVARGWVPDDNDAQTAYMNAVEESFTWLGVDDPISSADNYMSTIPFADWSTAGAGVEAKAKFIVFQKYIALTGIDPLEAYSDQRRLNFLTDNSYLSTDLGAAKMLPLRLLYPQSEYNTNSVNVLKEGTIDPFQSKLFWEP